ncbi:MAG: NAD(P)/FAD-dependent oxidoreductase [Gammaproteobacteria bacterium]|nr:NAD(P)/FAD-dependent oxidoreductase [Gammaproteobacteria bacterium]
MSNDQSNQGDRSPDSQKNFDVVIVGAGSGGIATASSLLRRNRELNIALIDPSTEHYYQPGWTMVGGGVFDAESTHRKTEDFIPSGTTWLQQSVVEFMPEQNQVRLDDGGNVTYAQLVVAPGLKLNWAGVEGLERALGENGVTSNYRFDLAPYTWKLVQELNGGKAVFTQPPMPIKCAGAPQKAVYLSASEWQRSGKLKDINIEFYNAGGVIFAVEEYVPALNSYMQNYGVDLKFMHDLVKVDGPAQTAWFKTKDDNDQEITVETKFDMLHVTPPQCAPDFIRDSSLSNDAGWLDVDPATLQHTRHNNIWGVGDVMSTTNAKTMAAARKQAPVVAHNICAALKDSAPSASYDGYGSCPLTVEHGKIVLAEFCYGGKVNPTFPEWLNSGTKPTRLAWFLKARLLPFVYWNGMLKGREWLAAPKV